MKKLIIAMIFMFTCFIPAFSDFTIDDLFVSGGTSKPVDTKDESKEEHDCQ